MKIRPILFNTDMVRAILDGRKTVTRRVCKDGNDYTVPDMSFYDADKRTYAVHSYADKQHTDKLSIAESICPICPGDILYVRETWQCWRAHRYESTADIRFKAGGGVQIQFANGNSDSVNRCEYDEFVAKWYSHHGEWRPSIHMPKEAARIWLKVTDVRVERLHDITEEQAEAEGIYQIEGNHIRGYYTYEIHIKTIGRVWHTARECFRWGLWDSTIKKSDIDRYGWDANPWVWVIEFERCEKPEPCILRGIEPAEDKRPCIGYGTEQ